MVSDLSQKAKHCRIDRLAWNPLVAGEEKKMKMVLQEKDREHTMA